MNKAISRNNLITIKQTTDIKEMCNLAYISNLLIIIIINFTKWYLVVSHIITVFSHIKQYYHYCNWLPM